MGVVPSRWVKGKPYPTQSAGGYVDGSALPVCRMAGNTINVEESENTKSLGAP